MAGAFFLLLYNEVQRLFHFDQGGFASVAVQVIAEVQQIVGLRYVLHSPPDLVCYAADC